MIKTIKEYRKTFTFLFFYSLAMLLGFFLHKYYANGFLNLRGFISDFNILSSLLLGALYSQGAAAPIAAALFNLYPKGTSFLTVAIIGGIGAGLIDLVMYELIKHELHNELEKLKNNNLFKFLGKIPLIKNKIFITILGLFIIASPISDDLGTLLIEEEGLLKTKYFFIMDIILNTLGILFFLYI